MDLKILNPKDPKNDKFVKKANCLVMVIIYFSKQLANEQQRICCERHHYFRVFGGQIY